MNILDFLLKVNVMFAKINPELLKRSTKLISSHKLQSTLEEMRDISKVEMILFDSNGKVVASTAPTPDDFGRYIVDFVHSMAESQMLFGYHFFKVTIESRTEFVLLSNASTEEAYMVGRLAVCQVRNIVAMNQERLDRNNFMQNILLGNMLVVDMYNKAEKLDIPQAKRIVYVIEVKGAKDTVLMETVRGLVDDGNDDFVTEVDEDNIILVKEASELVTEDEREALAKNIADTLSGEAMVKVRIGYGGLVERLQDITRSYQEARMALEVGGIFYAERNTISYSRLGIGRLIYQLPISLCEMFIKEIFGDRKLDLDEETLSTVTKFFENDLNISETARQLYIHRNTLVYRLERFEKIVGLDVRRFEDAMTFKLSMMVIAHMNREKELGGVVDR